MKINNAVRLAITLTLMSGTALASSPVYLDCSLPGVDGEERRDFAFTVDESNGTVTFYVKEANATNVEKAVFGQETITWTNNSQFLSITRTINRVDLSFIEDTTVVGKTTRRAGTCVIKTQSERKF